MDNKKNNDKYYSLAPTSENDGKNLESDSYVDAFMWALQQKDIHNIALTGPLGSGKSSILCRLKKEAEKKEEKEEEKKSKKEEEKHIFLNISLAAFGNGNGDTEETDGDTKKICSTNVIARGILEQLFYSEDPKNIPLSRYKKLPTWNLKKFTIAAAAVYFLALLIFLFAIPDMFSKFISQCNDLRQLGVPAALIAVIFILIILGAFAVIDFLAWGIAKRCRGYKLAFKSGSGTAFVIEGDDEGNIFDKYLDEIIYFFEVTKYDVVIFEDVERFGNTEIFVQLRKLNELLQKDSRIKRDIRFIYAVRDDLFQTGDAEERTKFFDFIIPVIPVISNINSREKLTEFFNQKDWENNDVKISDDFIKDVSSKIYSMRCLKNITNEFIIYYKIFFKKRSDYLDPEKLLALIIYKNLRPREFGKLQEREGIIAAVLSTDGKHELGEYLKKNKPDIKEKRWDLISAKELLDDIDLTSSDNKLKIGVEELDQDSLEYFMLQKGYIDENYPSYIIYNAPNDNAFIIDEKRTEMLFGSRLKNAKKDIHDIDIQYFNSRNLFSNKGLVMYLLEHDQEQGDDDYSAKREIALGKLTDGSIDSGAFLFDLWKSMKYKPEGRRIFISSITKHWKGNGFWEFVRSHPLIANENESRKDIVAEMIQWADEEDIIKQLPDEENIIKQLLDVENIIKQLPDKENIIKQLSNGEEVRNEQLIKLLNDKKVRDEQLIKLLNDNDIENMPINIFIAYYMPDFIQRVQTDTIGRLENVQKIKNVIEKWPIQFYKLEAEEPDDLLLYIFKSRHFDFNVENVKFVLRVFGGVPSEDIERKNYTSISNANSIQWFWLHIIDVLPRYIENVFLKLPKNTEESEESVAKICSNSKQLTLEMRMKVIDKENIEISDISKFPEDLWNYILEKEKLEATVKNITTYLDHEDRESFDEELLCQYIESHTLKIVKSITECGNEGQTVDSSIYNKVLQSRNISNDKKATVVNAVIKANNMTEKSQREEILKTAGLDYLLKSDYPADGSQEIKELWSLLHDNCENE